MTGNKQELIRYRIARAYETLEDAQILAEQKRWNSSINRLYYAAYYAVMALLLADNLFPATHNGAKSNFNQYFISTNRIDKSFGKFTPNYLPGDRKGDYDDLFDFDEEKVVPYFKPVGDLIQTIDALLD